LANIGTWSVRIIANTFGFDQKVDKSNRKAKTFQKSIASAGKQLSAFGSLLTGGLIGGGMVSFLDRTIKTNDALAKTAAKLGVSVAELQTLQYAANRSGVSTETLNMALQRMVRKLGEAKRGGAEATKALSLFGVNAKEISQLRPFDAFAELLKSAEGLSQSSRVDIFQKVFDSEGVALVNMVGMNMQRVNNHLRQMGILIDDLDANKFEQLADQMTDIQYQASAIGNSLAIDIAPHLLKAGEGAKIFAENFKIVTGEINKISRALGGPKNLLTFGQNVVAKTYDFYTKPFELGFSEDAQRNFARGITTRRGVMAHERRLYGTPPTPPQQDLTPIRSPAEFRGRMGSALMLPLREMVRTMQMVSFTRPVLAPSAD